MLSIVENYLSLNQQDSQYFVQGYNVLLIQFHDSESVLIRQHGLLASELSLIDCAMIFEWSRGSTNNLITSFCMVRSRHELQVLQKFKIVS